VQPAHEDLKSSYPEMEFDPGVAEPQVIDSQDENPG